jgi:hypothetical protein
MAPDGVCYLRAITLADGSPMAIQAARPDA